MLSLTKNTQVGLVTDGFGTAYLKVPYELLLTLATSYDISLVRQHHHELFLNRSVCLENARFTLRLEGHNYPLVIASCPESLCNVPTTTM